MARTDTIAVSLPPARRAQWILIRSIRWGVHATALVGVFLVGFSWPAAVALAIGTLTGSLSVTLCYHRYFAHKIVQNQSLVSISAGAVGRHQPAARPDLVGGRAPPPPPPFRYGR